MASLSRTVPFVLKPDDEHPGALLVGDVGGLPAFNGFACYLEVEVVVHGEPDARSGYLISITEIDRAVRAELPEALAAVRTARQSAPNPASFDELLRTLFARMTTRFGGSLARLSLRTTPNSSLTIEIAMPDTVLLTRRFDFSAAHRLLIPELTDEENFARFGKCSRPSGHGHNYRVDVTVARSLEAPASAVTGAGANAEKGTSSPPSLPSWESIVQSEVIDRYDHRHLNLDCPEFQQRNPSVEHIAKTIHERLAARLPEVGVTLKRVCVWETEKTWCAYPA